MDSYSWEERESIAYWWSLLSVFDASAPPVFAEALIKTYEVHEEDPVRKCFFSVTRDEQNHEIMCGLAITKLLGHPDPITYVPKTELGKRLQADDRVNARGRRDDPARSPVSGRIGLVDAIHQHVGVQRNPSHGCRGLPGATCGCPGAARLRTAAAAPLPARS